MFSLFSTKQRVLPDYSQVSSSIFKIQKILNESKSLMDVEVAERMFLNFLKNYSDKRERESSHIIYGIQMNINEKRAEFEQSTEIPYKAYPMKTFTQLNAA